MRRRSRASTHSSNRRDLEGAGGVIKARGGSGARKPARGDADDHECIADADARAAAAEGRRDSLEHDLEELRESLREATQREAEVKEALHAAREEAQSANEHMANLDAETEALRLTTNAVVGARESAIARELQLDEATADLRAELSQALDEIEPLKERLAQASAYVTDLERMVLAELMHAAWRSGARPSVRSSFSSASRQSKRQPTSPISCGVRLRAARGSMSSLSPPQRT